MIVRAGTGSLDAGPISRMTPRSTCRSTGAESGLPAILALRMSKSIMRYASRVSSSARHPEPSNLTELSVPLDLEREAVRTAAHLRELTQVGCVNGESLRHQHLVDDPVLGEGQDLVVAEGENVAAGLHDLLEGHLDQLPVPALEIRDELRRQAFAAVEAGSLGDDREDHVQVVPLGEELDRQDVDGERLHDLGGVLDPRDRRAVARADHQGLLVKHPAVPALDCAARHATAGPDTHAIERLDGVLLVAPARLVLELADERPGRRVDAEVTRVDLPMVPRLSFFPGDADAGARERVYQLRVHHPGKRAVDLVAGVDAALRDLADRELFVIVGRTKKYLPQGAVRVELVHERPFICTRGRRASGSHTWRPAPRTKAQRPDSAD